MLNGRIAWKQKRMGGARNTKLCFCELAAHESVQWQNALRQWRRACDMTLALWCTALCFFWANLIMQTVSYTPWCIETNIKYVHIYTCMLTLIPTRILVRVSRNDVDVLQTQAMQQFETVFAWLQPPIWRLDKFRLVCTVCAERLIFGHKHSTSTD